MAIVIRMGEKANEKMVRLELNARQSLNGDVMIFDHGDIDIVLSPANKKITAFPKETMSDLVYGAQNRLFTFLRKKGIIKPETVQAGNVYGSMEAVIQESADENLSAAKVTLLNISKFIDEERPYFASVDTYDDMMDDALVDPDEENSTELGEVPHEEKKGSITKGVSTYNDNIKIIKE